MKAQRCACHRDTEPLSADDFLSILIYITVQAQVPWLDVMHEYAFSLSSPEALRAESGYFMTALAAAIQFIGTYGMEEDQVPSDDHADSDSERSDDGVQRTLELPDGGGGLAASNGANDAAAGNDAAAPVDPASGKQSPRLIVDDGSTNDRTPPRHAAATSSTIPADGTRHHSYGELVQSPLGAFAPLNDPALLDRDTDWGIPAAGIRKCR
jgi:hypothetical protein